MKLGMVQYMNSICGINGFREQEKAQKKKKKKKAKEHACDRCFQHSHQIINT